MQLAVKIPSKYILSGTQVRETNPGAVEKINRFFLLRPGNSQLLRYLLDQTNGGTSTIACIEGRDWNRAVAEMIHKQQTLNIVVRKQWRRNRGSGGSTNRGPRVVEPQKIFRQDS